MGRVNSSVSSGGGVPTKDLLYHTVITEDTTKISYPFTGIDTSQYAFIEIVGNIAFNASDYLYISNNSSSMGSWYYGSSFTTLDLNTIPYNSFLFKNQGNGVFQCLVRLAYNFTMANGVYLWNYTPATKHFTTGTELYVYGIKADI